MLKKENLTLKITSKTITTLLPPTKLLPLCTLLKLKDFLTYTPLGYKTVMRNKDIMMLLPPPIKVI